jgi:hypothetical protein
LALANGIKAKPASIDDGISTVEREFLSDIILPSDESVGDWAVPAMMRSRPTTYASRGDARKWHASRARSQRV